MLVNQAATKTFKLLLAQIYNKTLKQRTRLTQHWNKIFINTAQISKSLELIAKEVTFWALLRNSALLKIYLKRYHSMANKVP